MCIWSQSNMGCISDMSVIVHFVLKQYLCSGIEVIRDTLAWEGGVAGWRTHHLSIPWETELYIGNWLLLVNNGTCMGSLGTLPQGIDKWPFCYLLLSGSLATIEKGCHAWVHAILTSSCTSMPEFQWVSWYEPFTSVDKPKVWILHGWISLSLSFIHGICFHWSLKWGVKVNSSHMCSIGCYGNHYSV